MTLISEFKSRNIWSTLAVYLGGGWVVIEAINFLSEKYGWSGTVIDLVILTVFFGLPAVMIQAWFHGKPGKQIFKKSEFALHGANAVLFLTLTIRLLFFSSTPTVAKAEVERSIAVIPFINRSADQENQFFADGVIEAVRNNLGKINELWVTSGNSTEQYRNSTKTSSEIANESGVAYVLSGSIQKFENHIRIIAELSDTKQNKQIWSEVFDREFNDLFRLQSEIAIEIAQELNLKLSPQETSLITKKHTDNIDAYVQYLEGQSLLRSQGRSLAHLDSAAKIFENVIEVEPNFSLAYVGLANTYLAHVVWGRTVPKEILPLVLETTRKAIQIDNSIGETYQILGLVKFYQTDFETAEVYFLKALSLNPNHVESYVWLGCLYAYHARYDEALAMFEKAQSLDPSATNYRFYKLAMVDYFGRNYQSGIDEIAQLPENMQVDSEIQWILGGFLLPKRRV